MEIAFLGAGNAFAPAPLSWSSFLLDRRLLFEAPPHLLPALKQRGRDLLAIDALVLSHFHGDHFAGLPFLLLEYTLRTVRSAPLIIIGPPGVGDRVEQLTRVLNTGVVRDPGRPFARDYVEVSDGAVVEVAGGLLQARRVQHAPDLESFGYRLSLAGKTIAYSGDSTYCRALVDLGAGADLFIVECSHPTEENALHMNLRLLQQLRDDLGPAPRFLITHRESEMPRLGIPNAEIVAPDSIYDV